jgi:hypothetical protein
MSYVLQTSERGLVLHPDTSWDGTADHEFVLLGRCDASYKSFLVGAFSCTALLLKA